MNHSPLIRALVFLGPSVFVDILRDTAEPITGQFANICHLCWHIFSRKETGKLIHDYFQKLEQNEAQKVIDLAECYFSPR